MDIMKKLVMYFSNQGLMKWYRGPTLQEARHRGSGFIDDEGRFHFLGGFKPGFVQQTTDTIDVLANDINAGFVESSLKLPAGYAE